MLTFTNERPPGQAGRRRRRHRLRFLPFSGLAGSVREDVETIRNSPFIPGDIPVSGYIDDVATGRLETVVPAD